MGCAGSKSVSNRVVPIAANPDDDVQALKGKADWNSGAVKNREDITDEEASNNTTPPRTAGEDEVTPIDYEEPRTPEDVSQVRPVNLDNLLEEAASMFPQTPKDSSGHVLQHLGDQGASRHAARSPTIPAKQEVADTTTGVSPWKDVHQQEAEDQPLPKRSSEEESEAAIPHWERQEPLPSRPGTSSRRPESSSGRLVVYKTAAQKKAEEAARRKRMDAETAAAAAGNLARPDTSSRKTSALPPLDERRRTKFAAPPSALPCDSLEAVGAISEVKGGAAWQLDAAEFVPEVSTCSSPVKRPSGRPPMAQKADVFTMDDNEESDGEEEEA